MTVQIEGLNLEKLLREAQDAGITLRSVRRVGMRSIEASISPRERTAMAALCERFGWTMEETRADLLLRAARFVRRRPMLPAAMLLCLLLVALSSRMVLRITVTGAREYSAQVSRVLADAGVRPGRFKRAVSTDALREALLLRLPGLKQASVRFAGSVLVVECHLACAGEQVEKGGGAMDLVAARDGVVTGITVAQGTPVVAIGDAVYRGQVLIRGEEKHEKGLTVPIQAQGAVTARVWAHGEARASLYAQTVRETGRTRRRVTIMTPFYERVVRDAQPFAAQNEIVTTERVVDLFIPLWRRTQVFEEIEVESVPRAQSDAASQAQGAAEKLAKKDLPAGVLILDKWVDYSMIDNEFVCASVVLEYEQDIAVRAEAARLSQDTR